ncbi:MAG: 2OG-Fe(II) oxygenase [Neisseriaceae bacterium]
MIDTKFVESSILEKFPFKHALIGKCISEENRQKLLEDMPDDNYYRSVREGGSDKTYNVVNNILLKLGEKKFNKDSNLSECWINLVNSLQSKQYIQALSNVLQENLLDCYQEVTLKIYGGGDFISPHTDKADVKATHMIFLNETWSNEWGGNLCLLSDADSVCKKIIPTIDNTLAFVRSDNSWHSVEEIKNMQAERIALQVVFWNVDKRYTLAGRIEDTVIRK